jgi:hypothetical protein
MTLPTTTTNIPTPAPEGANAAAAASVGGATAPLDLVVPPVVFDALAARMRPAGLFLLAMGVDGTLAYHDAAAESFFTRYALPLLRRQQESDSPVRQAVRSLAAAAAELPAGAIPGLTIVTVPYIERRQTAAVLVLVARSDTFGLTEDVLRACSQLELDGQWLLGAAKPLPAYGGEALLRQGKLLQGMVRDSVKLNGL